MKIIILLASVLAFISCKKDQKEATISADKKMIAKAEDVVIESHQDLYGSWVGDFVALEYSQDDSDGLINTNKINFILKKIVKDTVYGQSVVAGNLRPFKGTISEINNELIFVVMEPGNDKNDGKFEFKILRDTLSGVWTANSKKKKVIKREYKLVKQEFKYNPKLMLPEDGQFVDYYDTKTVTENYDNGDGTVETYSEQVYRTASSVISTLNASTTKLQEIDVKNLKKLELEIIRNTIFARHGYTFKKKTYRQFFDPVAWYVPVSNDVSGSLSDLEKENITLLKRFEKYAIDNYDTFGR
ncbi:YARHG domain-containing protein [Flavobacterium sp.]|uniref:YARHG domain-containing protein n=1 Tax=Flavobacterium sp. TaxID=239 RepID=UPI003750057A